jgi:hypothetical protein
MDNSRGIDRKIGSDAMSAALALRDDLPGVLARTRAPSKVLAFSAHVSKRTIEGIKRKEHVISAGALIELARQYPEIKTYVLELMGPVEQDPAWLMAQLQKHLGKK